MAEYIDRDIAIRTAIEMCVKVVGHGITQFDAAEIANAFEDIPTADVVPKSEVEDYKHNWQKIHDSYNADCLEHYNKGQQDAAREIFEEIEKYKRSPMPECKPVYVINDSGFAELKKKYTGGKT